MDIKKFKKQKFISDFIVELEEFDIHDRLEILHKIVGEYDTFIADELVDSLSNEWYEKEREIRKTSNL